MDRLEIDSSAFDQVSLHDVNIYGLFLQRRQHEVNFVLDIDYLGEWTLLPDKRFDFLVTPATLTFLDVVDLQIHLDWGPSLRKEEPYGIMNSFLGEPSVYDFCRFAYTDPVYTERSYHRYELTFSVPLDGRISLGATGFTIVGRQEGTHSNHQTLDPDQRPPLILGG
jgi:hypothetical protein